MNRIIIFTVAIAIMVSTIFADSEMKPKPVSDILSEIMQEQSVTTSRAIRVDKVSESKLEELGDSVMEAMIGNSATHEQMDNMMGGDGSASLAAMHKRIGYNYLVGYPTGMMAMMSGGMMGLPYNTTTTSAQGIRSMMNGNFAPGMMGSFGWGFGGMFMMFMWLIFIIFLTVIVFLVIKSALTGNFKVKNESPLEILKKRYAKGEISKEDFEKMKNDISF